MVDKIFGTDFSNNTSPSGTSTISINNGTTLEDVTLNDILKIIAALSSDTAPAGGDSMLTWDVSATAVKQVLLSNLHKALTQATDTQAGTVELATNAEALTNTDTVRAVTPAGLFLPPGCLYGLTLSNNGSDATNDIDISAGKCRDGSDTVNMVLASVMTKRLDANWGVGTNGGGLDTGSIANATYHIWLIKRSDTGVVDALFSLSASAPTMPANYDYKRRIGSIVRASASIRAFIQDGDQFMWKSPVSDVTAANPGTSAVTRTLSLPTGIRVNAIVQVNVTGTTQPNLPGAVYLSDLSLTDVSASSNTAASILVYASSAISDMYAGLICQVFTNTSAQIRSRLQISGAGTTLQINTAGWVDTRGRLG
jgi:hypothetical protein